MASPTILRPNIADAELLTLISDLQIRVARLEEQIAPRICCECSRPEECGDLDCPDARHYDALEWLNAELLADADPFGIGPVAGLSEAIVFPPPPHVGVRRAARMLAEADRDGALSYVDHARACTSFDGGAA